MHPRLAYLLGKQGIYQAVPRIHHIMVFQLFTCIFSNQFIQFLILFLFQKHLHMKADIFKFMPDIVALLNQSCMYVDFGQFSLPLFADYAKLYDLLVFPHSGGDQI